MRPPTPLLRFSFLLPLFLFLLLINHVAADETVTRLFTVTKRATITSIATVSAGAKTTILPATTTITSTYTAPTKSPSTTSAAPKTDLRSLTLTITSTIKTTLPPVTTTAAAAATSNAKRLARRQIIGSFFSSVFKIESTTTVSSTRTITSTIIYTSKVTSNAAVATRYAKTATNIVTVTPSASSSPDEEDNEPTETGYGATKTVLVTQTSTPAPVVVPAKGEKKTEEGGMTSGQKAGVGAAVGVIAAGAIGLGAFIFMKKRKGKKEMEEEEKGFRTETDGGDTVGRTGSGGAGQGYNNWSSPPRTGTGSTPTAAAAAAGAVFGGAAAARATASSPPAAASSSPVRANPSYPMETIPANQSYPMETTPANLPYPVDTAASFSQPQYPVPAVLPQSRRHSIPPPSDQAPFGPDSYSPPNAAPSFAGNHQMATHPTALIPGFPNSSSSNSSPSTVSPISRNSRSFTAPVADPNGNRGSIYAPPYGAASWMAQHRQSSYGPGMSGLSGSSTPSSSARADITAAAVAPSASPASASSVKRKPIAPPSEVKPKYQAYRPGSVLITPPTPVVGAGAAAATVAAPVSTVVESEKEEGKKEMNGDAKPAPTVTIPSEPVVKNGEESGGFSPPPVERKEDVPAIVTKRNSAWEKASEYM